MKITCDLEEFRRLKAEKEKHRFQNIEVIRLLLDKVQPDQYSIWNIGEYLNRGELLLVMQKADTLIGYYVDMHTEKERNFLKKILDKDIEECKEIFLVKGYTLRNVLVYYREYLEPILVLQKEKRLQIWQYENKICEQENIEEVYFLSKKLSDRDYNLYFLMQTSQKEKFLLQECAKKRRKQLPAFDFTSSSIGLAYYKVQEMLKNYIPSKNVPNSMLEEEEVVCLPAISKGNRQWNQEMQRRAYEQKLENQRKKVRERLEK
ncbi:MAG: hypothetical protein ACLU8F_03970 [Clostridia bacterium]